MTDIMWEMAAAVYFSSLIFVIVPLLGLASGAVTGRLTKGVSTGLGAVVGFTTGASALVALFLLGWATAYLVNLDIPSDLALAVAFSPLALALVVPVAVLQVIRFRRGMGH